MLNPTMLRFSLLRFSLRGFRYAAFIIFHCRPFCFLSTAASLAAQGVQITGAVTARQPIPNDYCTMPPSEDRFLTTDSAVWVVLHYSGGQAGDKATVDWFDPTGTLYRTYSFTQSSSGGNYCYAYYISIYGYFPATSPGNWRVRLRWNDTEAFSKSFAISAPPASPLTLITDTTFPKATLGAPYSLNLQASGGTAPYRWSFTSGTPASGNGLYIRRKPERHTDPHGILSNGVTPGRFGLTAEYSGPGCYLGRRPARVEHRRGVAGLFLHRGRRGAGPSVGEPLQRRPAAELSASNDVEMAGGVTEDRDIRRGRWTFR